jgi:hypothetical protein
MNGYPGGDAGLSRPAPRRVVVPLLVPVMYRLAGYARFFVLDWVLFRTRSTDFDHD